MDSVFMPSLMFVLSCTRAILNSHISRERTYSKNGKEEKLRNKLCILFHLPASDLQTRILYAVLAPQTPHLDENKCES